MFKQKFTVSNVNRRIIAQFMGGNQEFVNAGSRFNLSHQFHKYDFRLQVGITKEQLKRRPSITIICMSDDPKLESEAKDLTFRIQMMIKNAIKHRKAGRI